jgi:formyl-CoA transferase
MIGAPEIADDPRFVDGESRLQHRDALDTRIGEAFRARNTAEWVDLLAEVVPCGPVLRIDEVFADPQVQHLEMTRTVDDPTGRPIDVLRPPLTFSDTPATVRRGPPAAGAQTREVLAEIGYADAEIDALLEDGAVAMKARR